MLKKRRIPEVRCIFLPTQTAAFQFFLKFQKPNYFEKKVTTAWAALVSDTECIDVKKLNKNDQTSRVGLS